MIEVFCIQKQKYEFFRVSLEKWDKKVTHERRGFHLFRAAPLPPSIALTVTSIPHFTTPNAFQGTDTTDSPLGARTRRTRGSECRGFSLGRWGGAS